MHLHSQKIRFQIQIYLDFTIIRKHACRLSSLLKSKIVASRPRVRHQTYALKTGCFSQKRPLKGCALITNSFELFLLREVTSRKLGSLQGQLLNKMGNAGSKTGSEILGSLFTRHYHVLTETLTAIAREVPPFTLLAKGHLEFLIEFSFRFCSFGAVRSMEITAIPLPWFLRASLYVLGRYRAGNIDAMGLLVAKSM